MSAERTEEEVAKLLADVCEAYMCPAAVATEPVIAWPDAEKTPNSFAIQLEEDGPRYAVVVMRI